MNKPYPFDLSLDEFLGSFQTIEDSDMSHWEMVVNRAQNHDFDDTRELLLRGSANPSPITENFKSIGSEIPSIIDGSLRYLKTASGVKLIDSNGDIVGFYIDNLLSVLEDHREKGIGTEIIIIASLMHRTNPAIDTKYGTQYTRSGLASHRRAWTVMQQPNHYWNPRW